MKRDGRTRSTTHICAHDRSSLEGYDFQTGLLALLDILLGHVTQSNLVLRNLNLKVERSLKVWLIEAGKSSASIAGFELGAEHVVMLIISGDRCGSRNGRLVLRSVETRHDVVHGAAKLDDESGLGRGRHAVGKLKSSALGFLVVRDIGDLNTLLSCPPQCTQQNPNDRSELH